MLDFYNELASLHSESLFSLMGYLSGECALTYSETSFQSKCGGTLEVTLDTILCVTIISPNVINILTSLYPVWQHPDLGNNVD